MNCTTCGKMINKPESYFNRQIKKGYTNFFCSNECRLEYSIKNAFKVKCTNCGKEFKPAQRKSEDEHYFCSCSCAATYMNHFRVHTKEQSEKKSKSLKTYHLLHPQSIRRKEKIKKVCPICHKEFEVPPCYKDKTYCSRKCYYDDREHKFRKIGEGGLRSGSGRGKKGWYKGYECDSSWELAFVIYNLEHDIKFERNRIKYEYQFEGKTHNYYPDFIMEDGSLVEIKGIMDQKNRAKLTALNKQIIIIDKEGIQKYLDYTIQKYGKDFIQLYEGNPHNLKKNKCVICGKPCKNICCSRVCIGKYRVKQRKEKKNKDLM